MSPFAILLHAWRLRRIRRAMRTLSRRMAAYEAAYGLPPFPRPNEVTS